MQQLLRIFVYGLASQLKTVFDFSGYNYALSIENIKCSSHKKVRLKVKHLLIEIYSCNYFLKPAGLN